MSHVPQPDADRGTEAAPLGDGHPRTARHRAATRAALTAAAVAALAVTALPWLPLAALSAATKAHPASTAASAPHRPAAGRSDRGHEGSRHLGSNAAGTGQIVRWFTQLAQPAHQPA